MSTEETASPEVAHPEHAAPQRQGMTFRIVLIVLLVLAVVALVIDRQAQSKAQTLHDELVEMYESASARDKPLLNDVHDKIGFEPADTYDHDRAANTMVEEYRYRGGLPWRTYTVYVYYRKAPEERLYSVSLNQPEEF
jgi:hypothetical protein